MSLKATLQDDMKAAMRSKDKERLATLRLISAAIKQREVDEQTTIEDDGQIIAILDRMVKQRRESISQYSDAGRDDLAQKEQQELAVIQSYMPQPLSDEEVEAAIDGAIAQTNAQSVKEMGKVMAILKEQLQGRVDMSEVSHRLKRRLSAG